MYLAFGPVLFLFCLFGFSALPSLAYECLPNRIGNKLNLMDVLILFICATMSFTILFMFSLSKVNRLAETDLSDDTSMFYQVFVSFMKSKRNQYIEEKRRRRLRTEQNYRQEEIKDQDDEIGTTEILRDRIWTIRVVTVKVREKSMSGLHPN